MTWAQWISWVKRELKGVSRSASLSVFCWGQWPSRSQAGDLGVTQAEDLRED